MKKDKGKIFLGVAFLSGLSISILSFYFFSVRSKETKETPSSSQITISLSKMAPYDLTVSASEDETISALSVRLVYDYKGKIKPDIQKANVNDDLKNLGWEYPINKVSYDDVNNIAMIDISLVNTLPEGYQLKNQIMIANLNTSVPFFFDKDMTKVIDKKGKELTLNYFEK